jgi:hypothetical protein
MLLTLLVAAIAAAGAYAYANSINGVTPPRIGSGSGVIGKYSITGGLSSVVFTLDATDTRNIDAITFPLTGATAVTVVTAQLAGNWYACSSAAAPTITCATTAPQVLATAANGSTLTIVAKG